MKERGWIKTSKSIKFGCLCAMLAVGIASAIAAVLLSLYVPGAWREKSFFENPAGIVILIIGVIGFILGFVSEIRRKL